MNRHRLLRLSAAATVAVVTGGLLCRVSRTPYVPVAPHPATPQQPAVPSSSPGIPLPSVFPTVTDGAPVSPGKKPAQWKLAFEVQNDIWTMQADGTGAHRVLSLAAQPCWSPSCRHLAFARGGNVWIADADGGHQKQMTFWPADPPYSETHPIYPRDIRGISWNRKDHILSFGRDVDYMVSNGGGETTHLRGQTIYHLALEPGKDAHGTTETPFAVAFYPAPFNSNDCNVPAIWRRTPPQFDLAEGHGTFHFAHSAYPAWSADGTKLAFVRDGDIWLAESESDNLPDDQRGYAQNWDIHRIAACAEYDGHTVGGSHWTVAATTISWAPDGSFLVYEARRITGSGQNDIHILKAPTREGEEWKESDRVFDGHYPCVSPDSHGILYNGSRIQPVTGMPPPEIVYPPAAEAPWIAVW